jgi:hypothetical protein
MVQSRHGLCATRDAPVRSNWAIPKAGEPQRLGVNISAIALSCIWPPIQIKIIVLRLTLTCLCDTVKVVILAK